MRTNNCHLTKADQTKCEIWRNGTQKTHCWLIQFQLVRFLTAVNRLNINFPSLYLCTELSYTFSHFYAFNTSPPLFPCIITGKPFSRFIVDFQQEVQCTCCGYYFFAPLWEYLTEHNRNINLHNKHIVKDCNTERWEF